MKTLPLLNQILTGDALEQLKRLPDRLVHSCICSPPYFQKRNYHVDGQIGQERTPEAYIENLVNVFREVKRVLRDDGTVWVNIDDSYQDKQLLGIPFRFAMAMQEIGYLWRSTCIWAKRDPMPESVKDRPTSAHEYIFLFSKSPNYYYDHVATREPMSDHQPTVKRAQYRPAFPKKTETKLAKESLVRQSPKGYISPDGRKNRRSVFLTTTSRLRKYHHFAAYPPQLIEPCVLSTPKQVCPYCHTPWHRIEMTDTFRPMCSCLDNDGSGVAIILDPFLGSGTTALVALEHGRAFIGIELNPDYVHISRERIWEWVRQMERELGSAEPSDIAHRIVRWKIQGML